MYCWSRYICFSSDEKNCDSSNSSWSSQKNSRRSTICPLRRWNKLKRGEELRFLEFFWEDQEEFEESQFFSSLLKQIYLDQQYVPGEIHVPVEFEDRDALAELLSEKRGRNVEIRTPQRGQKKALLGLVQTNAKHSFDARFRVLKPSSRAIQEALQDSLNLPSAPARIECFDISHIQGTDKVASMVVWED